MKPERAQVVDIGTVHEDVPSARLAKKTSAGRTLANYWNRREIQELLESVCSPRAHSKHLTDRYISGSETGSKNAWRKLEVE